jgi:hypothetical protein
VSHRRVILDQIKWKAQKIKNSYFNFQLMQ